MSFSSASAKLNQLADKYHIIFMWKDVSFDGDLVVYGRRVIACYPDPRKVKRRLRQNRRDRFYKDMMALRIRPVFQTAESVSRDMSDLPRTVCAAGFQDFGPSSLWVMEVLCAPSESSARRALKVVHLQNLEWRERRGEKVKTAS